jgi:hypothetical protein
MGRLRNDNAGETEVATRRKGISMHTPTLTEAEVEERLNLCVENAAVVDELYEFGKILSDQVIDRIRAVESKATSFAAYGAAIATFLVTSVLIWSKLGNQWSPWISFCAGICGLTCTVFALRALWLRAYEWISEDEWMHKDCLSKIDTLKRYRIFTMWGVIHSHSCIQSKKARELERAQIWLVAAVVCLLYLLLHIAFVVNLDNDFWIPAWQRMVQGHLGIPAWQSCGGWACGLILGLTLAFTLWRTLAVRLR